MIAELDDVVISELEQGCRETMPCFFEDFTLRVKLYDDCEHRTFMLYPMSFSGKVFGLDLFQSKMITVQQTDTGALEIVYRRMMRKNRIITTALLLLNNK